jgi:hypothetical protein
MRNARIFELPLEVAGQRKDAEQRALSGFTEL